MEITTASFLDISALNKLEHVCFEKDAWSFLDLGGGLDVPGCDPLKGDG